MHSEHLDAKERTLRDSDIGTALMNMRFFTNTTTLEERRRMKVSDMSDMSHRRVLEEDLLTYKKEKETRYPVDMSDMSDNSDEPDEPTHWSGLL